MMVPRGTEMVTRLFSIVTRTWPPESVGTGMAAGDVLGGPGTA
jgi:hypothetical protein